jgi:tetratricopeptide (TPR) repeat protein
MHKLWCCTLPFLVLLSWYSFAQVRSTKKDIHVDGTVAGLPAGSLCSIELTSDDLIDALPSVPCFGNTFQINDVRPGDYNLVVHYGIQQYSQEVTLMLPREELRIEIPQRKQASSEAAVSVSQMEVPKKAKQELQKAIQSLNHADFNKATQHVLAALRVAPTFAKALTIEGVLEMAKQDFGSALQTLNHAAALDPMLPMTQFARASVLNSMGHARQAEMAAEEGLRLGGDSWQGHYELARSLYAQREVQESLLEINRAATGAPKHFAEIYLLKASVLFDLSDTKGARENLNHFTGMQPGDTRSARLQQLLDGKANR